MDSPRSINLSPDKMSPPSSLSPLGSIDSKRTVFASSSKNQKPPSPPYGSQIKRPLEKASSKQESPKKKKNKREPKPKNPEDTGKYPNMIYMSVSKNVVEKKFSYISLADPKDVFGDRYPSLFDSEDPDISLMHQDESKYVPQRTALWYRLRDHCITGSVMKDFLCFTHGKHKNRIGLGMVDDVDPVDLYKKFLVDGQTSKDKIEPYTQSWVNMNWGSFHEFSAIYIYLEAIGYAKKGTKILTPDMPDKWAESGLWLLTEERYNNLMKGFNRGKYMSFNVIPNIGASPDGLYPSIENPTVCFEIKCRSVYCAEKDGSFRRAVSNYENGRGRPFIKIPTYYIPQIQMQMLVTGAVKCVFISWTPSNGTNVFIVDKDIEYCQKMMHMIAMCTTEILLCEESNRQPRREIYECSLLCEELLSLSEKIANEATLYKLDKREIINESINVKEIGKDKFLDSKPEDIIKAFSDTDLILDLLDGKQTRFTVQ